MGVKYHVGPTLTNYVVYFESMGVGIYDKALKFKLATDMKQVIKPNLTGPFGAHLYDKAVMYKSTSITEPVYFEFTDFKGSSLRDYWLDIILEILNAHNIFSDGMHSHSGAPRQSVSGTEVAANEKYERTKSYLETGIVDLRDCYFQMSLRYAKVEAQREVL
ncbi:hypothetical protein AgCh_000293 [Apium graveolens]